jgi:hypothetical protein
VRPLLFSAVLFCAAGCARPEYLPLNRAALRASQPRTILATLRPYPPFWKTHREWAPVWFGLVGKAVSESAAEAEGSQLRTLGVRDPADAIAVVLLEGLVKRFTLRVKHASEPQPLEMSAKELSGVYPHADLVLDVRTTRWGVSPTSATRYAIHYQGRLRLIDTRRRAVVADGTCVVEPDHQPNDPSWDALMWNDAASLKERLWKVIERCADDYRTRVLGMTMEETGGK